MAKAKDPSELSVEEKLTNLYELQKLVTEIDRIKTVRGELPLEVKDLEDEIAGLETRIEKINESIEATKREIVDRGAVIEKNKLDMERFETQMKNVRNNRDKYVKAMAESGQMDSIGTIVKLIESQTK